MRGGQVGCVEVSRGKVRSSPEGGNSETLTAGQGSVHHLLEETHGAVIQGEAQFGRATRTTHVVRWPQADGAKDREEI